MANIVTYSSELKLTCKFDDDDTRVLTLDNPKYGLTAEMIHDIETEMITTQPIIGDKTGAAFVGFIGAYTIDRTKIKLDLSR